LQQNDVISVRMEYVSGFFSLFRNTELCRNLFRQSKDYKKIFQSTDSYCFDECNYEFEALIRGDDIFNLTTEIESMTHVVKKADRENIITAHFETLVAEGSAGGLEWNHGTLYNHNKKVLLYHLIEFKKLLFRYIPSWKSIPDKYFINSFYISKYQIKSISGTFLHLGLNLLNFLCFSKVVVTQFVKWRFSHWSTSKIISHLDKSKMKDWAGIYRKRGISITIFSDGMHLFLGYFNNPKILLLEKCSGVFLVAKFIQRGLIHTYVEFHYDQINSIQTLHVKPFANDVMILDKIDPDG